MSSMKSKPGLGANIGHGFVKIVVLIDGHEPQSIVLPAAVAPAQKQLAGALLKIDTVDVAGGSWWVGEDAALSNNMRTVLSQERIFDSSYIPALVKAALSRIQGNGIPAEEIIATAKYVTGLPATWSTDQELARALAQRLRVGTGVADLKPRVIAEPLGIVYAALLNNDGEVAGDPVLQTGKVAVIDLGHHTVDVAVVDRMRPMPERLATFQLGTSKPLAAIKQRLAARFEIDYSLHAVDQAMQVGKIKVAGQMIDLPSGTEQPLRDNGAAIAVQLRELWGNGGQFDTILIGGGGSAVPAIVEQLKAQFPHAQPVQDGQMAVAMGYARLARRFGKQH